MKTRLKAAVAVVAMVIVSSVPALTADAAAGVVGVVGCSNTAIATIGYHRVSAEGTLWYADENDNPFADYWGMDIVKWADVDGAGRAAWAAFDVELAQNPDTEAIWFEVCVRAETPGTTATVDEIVAEILRRAPEVTIYASPLDDTPTCTVGDPDLSADFVDHLVETGQAARGPIMSPLPADQVKGCHASGDGITLHGSDLAAFFDTGGPLPTPDPTTTFDDVPADHVFASDIAWLADEGITRGCNPPVNDRFCPDDPVTRGQMAAFMVRALGLPASPIDVFTDDDSSVFEADIQALAAAGVTTGCGAGLFCPDDPVTRAQMATFLVNANGYTAGAGDDLFGDDDGSVHERNIDALATAGVTRGCNPPANDLFCPDDPVTRGQMAAFLRRSS